MYPGLCLGCGFFLYLSLFFALTPRQRLFLFPVFYFPSSYMLRFIWLACLLVTSVHAVPAPNPGNVTAVLLSCVKSAVIWDYLKIYTMQFAQVNIYRNGVGTPISVIGPTTSFAKTSEPLWNTYSYDITIGYNRSGELTPNLFANTPCNSIQYRVQIVQAQGFTSESQFVTATPSMITLSIAPAPPSELLATSCQDGSCSTVLSWTPGANACGCFNSNCTAYYSTDPGMSGETAVVVTSGSDYQLTGLVGNTMYYAQVLCRNQCGTASNRSTVYSFQTPSIIAPANITARQLQATPGTVEVSWTATPGSKNCTILTSMQPDLSAATATAVNDGWTVGVVVGLTYPTAYYFGVECSPVCGGQFPQRSSPSVQLMVVAPANTTVVQSDTCCINLVSRNSRRYCNCSIY
jgi:hypothetical protein